MRQPSCPQVRPGSPKHLRASTGRTATWSVEVPPGHVCLSRRLVGKAQAEARLRLLGAQLLGAQVGPHFGASSTGTTLPRAPGGRRYLKTQPLSGPRPQAGPTSLPEEPSLPMGSRTAAAQAGSRLAQSSPLPPAGSPLLTHTVLGRPGAQRGTAGLPIPMGPGVLAELFPSCGRALLCTDRQPRAPHSTSLSTAGAAGLRSPAPQSCLR